MLTIKEMIEKRAKLVAQARGEFDKITEKTSDSDRAEINARFDTIMGEATQLTQDIEQRTRLEAAEGDIAATADPRRPTGSAEARAGQVEPAAIQYREAFHQWLQAAGDVHELNAETRAALRPNHTQLSAEQRAQIAGTGASGGFLVPDEMMAELVKAMAAWGPMFDDGFARVINTAGGGSMPIPGVDDTANKAAAEGSEGGDKGAGTDAVFTRKTLEDFLRTTGWLTVSVQLMSGSMAGVEGLLGELLGERLGRDGNHELTMGTGSGAPLGIVPGASLGVTAAGAAVTADEILEFMHAVDPAYRASPKYGMMFNDSTSLALSKLKDGSGDYLLRTLADGSQVIKISNVSARFTINQSMPNIGAGARSMVIGDMGKYYVRKIGATVIGTDRGKEFWPGFGIAGYQRFDGTVADTRAIKAFQHP